MNAPAYHLTQFASDVRRGLAGPGQKELLASYLYDELGSALFEAITLLPEYGLTRADARVLHAHARDIANIVSAPTIVVELGSGSGMKTRPVLQAFRRRQMVEYYPIDVSAAALRACAAELAAIAEVHPIEASYVDGLRRATRMRNDGHNLLVMFLGSTIGNFEREPALRFLSEVYSMLAPGDYLLIGADLVKPAARMLLAYDDPLGVTAAFNKNLLVRMNRELGADFELANFDHEARWNEEHRRIEMHLRSNRRQTVRLPDAQLTAVFSAGETIWTESSHKFKVEELEILAAGAGFTPERYWVDQEWPFAECLWRV